LDVEETNDDKDAEISALGSDETVDADRILQVITPDGVFEMEIAEDETPQQAVERALLSIQINHPDAKIDFIDDDSIN